MSTLTDLKARIASDIDDDANDFAAEIGESITAAIEFYQDTLFIKETRGLTFTTVNAQQIYTVSDAADLANVRDIFNVFSNDGSTTRELDACDPGRMEILSDNSAATGEPYAYSWFDEALWLYPVPGATTYTIRLHCRMAAAAPATGGETGNIWMVRGFELIRAKAKAILYDHVLEYPEKVGPMEARAAEQERRLVSRMNRLVGTGYVTPTCF